MLCMCGYGRTGVLFAYEHWDVKADSLWNSETYEEVVGRAPANPGHAESALERIHPEDRPRVERSLGDALRSDRQAWRCEYRVAAADGVDARLGFARVP